MKFIIASTAAAILALVQPSSQSPVSDFKLEFRTAATNNVVKIIVTEDLSVYAIHLNKTYKANGVFSLGTSLSLTVTNAPTHVNIQTSATSTSYSTTTTTSSSAGLPKGKTTTITTTTTVGGGTPTSTTSITDSSSGNSATATQTSISAASKAHTTVKTTHTSKSVSKVVSTSSAAVSTATALCDVATNGASEAAWLTSGGSWGTFSVDNLSECSSLCQEESACQTFAYNPGVMPIGQECVIFNTPVNGGLFIDVGTSDGYFYIWDKNCKNVAATETSIVAAPRPSNSTSLCNVVSGGATATAWSSVEGLYEAVSLDACVTMCWDIEHGPFRNCATYAYNPGTMATGQECVLFSETINSGSFTDVGVAGGYFYLWDYSCIPADDQVDSI